MLAHHRLPHRRHRGLFLLGQRLQRGQRVQMAEIVPRLASLHLALQRVGQRLIHGVHVGELGLAAGAAGLHAMQQRADAWNGAIAAVGVPELRQRHLLHRRMIRRHQVAVVVHVGDAEDLLHAARADDVLMEDLRLAEAAGEFDMLGVGDVLAGKHQHEMLHPHIMQRLERRRIERCAHVDAAHLGAERGMQRANLQLIRNVCCRGCHGRFLFACIRRDVRRTRSPSRACGSRCRRPARSGTAPARCRRCDANAPRRAA